MPMLTLCQAGDSIFLQAQLPCVTQGLHAWRSCDSHVTAQSWCLCLQEA